MIKARTNSLQNIKIITKSQQKSYLAADSFIKENRGDLDVRFD